MSNGQFKELYLKKMTDIMKKINPEWDEYDIEDIVSKMIDKHAVDPVVTLDNNYTEERRDTTLSKVLDWTIERKPIIAGNATFYKNQEEAINPIAQMLKDFGLQRKAYKKELFTIEDFTSPLYKDLDRLQLNEKINSNSYYGASGAPSSAFYSLWSGPAVTHSAQQVISTAENYFEGFIADNYLFLNLNECIEYIETMMKEYDDKNIIVHDWLQLHPFDTVFNRFYNKIMFLGDNDEKILKAYLLSYSDEELSFLYYKNNLLKFIEDHDNIKELIETVFENVENLEYGKLKDDEWLGKIPSKYTKDFIGKSVKDWNAFVNKQYFMDPNYVPKNLEIELNLIKEYILTYVHSRYLSADRIYRLRNFKRKVVTIIDTDSNILSLDTYVNFIFDKILKENTYGRSKKNNVFITINMLAFILTEGIENILLTYGEHSNVPIKFRPLYNMKNEFLFLRLIIGKTKKRYISKNVLREGNLMDPPKYDVKGFDFKKATTSEYSEKFFMGLLKEHVINSDDIEIKEITRKLKQFREDIITSIRNGETKFLPLANAKPLEAYKNPETQQSVKAVIAWNNIYPDNNIEMPSKVSILKLNIFDESDIEDLKETDIDIYNTIIHTIFNDTTGMFVKAKYIPPLNYVQENDKKWIEKLPTQYKNRFRNKSAKDWNDFIDSLDNNDQRINGYYEYKKNGMQTIAIPSNTKIPDWIDKYIDYATIVNNIISPFIPVLEIFKARTIDEGKTIKGVDRKSKALSNVIKF